MRKILLTINTILLILLFVADKLLNYYISNLGDSTDSIIKVLDSQYSIKLIQLIIGILLLASLVPSLLQLIRSPLDAKIEELTEKSKEQKYLLETKTANLVNELQDIFNFYEKEIIFNQLKKLTLYDPIIHSAQVYSYSQNINSTYTTYKISYVNGFAFEEIDINAMIQNYYKIPNKMYFQIKEIIEYSNQLDALANHSTLSTNLKTQNNTEEKIRKELEISTRKFITNYLPSITKKKEISELTEEDSIVLSMIELCFELNIKSAREPNISETKYSINLFEDDLMNQSLRSIKRTGILTGILKVNEHIFMNTGFSKKKGRIYITRCFELNRKKYVILLSLLPDILDFPNWEATVKNISNQFISNLKNDLDLVYNKDIESE